MLHVRDERGVMMVLFGVFLPLFLLIGVVTIDVGNWWVHKRHLQTQVDAAVFAGGSQFVGCNLNAPGANADIKAEALKYAGDTLRDPNTTNLQEQEPDDVRVALNSSTYWATANGTDATTGYGLDETLDGDPTTPGAQPSDPCSAKFLDAKATDDEAPLLWGLVPFVASPKTHARVEIRKLQGLSGFLPWAVPEVNPRTVAALFVDESETNTVESWSFLVGPADPNDTETLNGEIGARWTGLASVDVVDRTGMIVLTSRQLLTDAHLTGKSLSEICAMQSASCYGGTTNQSGVGFIRGTPVSDGPQVVLNDVELTTLPSPSGPDFPIPPSLNPCSVTDPDSSPYFLYNADCHLRIRAQIEFGSLPSSRTVRVNGNANCNSGGTELSLRDGWWESPWLPKIVPGTRRNGFTLCWKAGSGGGAPVGNFGGQMMQMTYAANPSVTNGSGPIVYSSVRSPSTGCTEYANALNVTTQTICVNVGLQPPLRVSDGDDPPVFLRTAASSLNQALDCDASPRGPEEEIRDGCLTPHQVNQRDLACGPSPSYSPSNLPLPLPPPDPDPWPDCIEANPGSVTSMSKGLKWRFEDPPPSGAGCPPNRWVDYRSAGKVPTQEDPRYVVLVIAEYGTFDDTGIKVLPITKFAGFYVTGWFTQNGPSMSQGCPDNDPPPTPPTCGGGPCDAGDTAVQGAVWGYFITQVFPNIAPPSDELCAFDELGTCIAVLVE
jgi:Flp pilus assembly protein TadG